MSLSVMTPEWTQTANEITVYMLRKREMNDAELQTLAASPTELFNTWVMERGIAVEQTELALWCVDYMQTCAKMPLRLLRKAAKYDGLVS